MYLQTLHKKSPCSFSTIYAEGIACENLQGLFWWNGISALFKFHKKSPCHFFIIHILGMND